MLVKIVKINLELKKFALQLRKKPFTSSYERGNLNVHVKRKLAFL